MLKRLTSILKYIFAHVAEVEVQIATRVGRILDKRVHHPEFDVFDVCILEVGCCKLTLDTSPTFARILEMSRRIHTFHIVVVRTFLVRIENHVERSKVLRYIGSLAVAIREKFLFVNKTCIMARPILDTQRRITLVQSLVDNKPRQQTSVLSIIQIVYQRTFGEQQRIGRRACKRPAHEALYIVGNLRTFEIVDVSSSLLAYCLRVTWNKLGKLRIESYGRHFLGLQQWQKIDCLGKERHIGSIRHVCAPDGIRQRFFANINLGSHWLFLQMQYCGSDVEVVGKIVVGMQTC